MTQPSGGRMAWRAVGGVAAAKVAFLLATAGLWGLHRDEFYYLAGGRRPAWGYVDHPPITPLLFRAGAALFGDSQRGLRVIPALLGGALVVLAALVVRELGGGRAAQLIAAAVAAVGPLYLTPYHFMGTVSVDLLCWAAASLFVMRIVRTGDTRWWVAVGLVCGVGLLNKHSMLFWIAGAGVGLLATPERRLLRSWWFVAGAGLALALFAPNLAWQAHHDWATLRFVSALRKRTMGQNLAEFIPFQAGMVTPVGTVVWIGALAALWRDPAWRPQRWLAIAYGVLFVALFASGGKAYYLGSIYVPLVAVGAVVLERTASAVRRRRLVAGVVATGALLAPFFTPVFPASWAASIPVQKANQDMAGMLGWHDAARQVAAVYHGLPAAEQSRAVVLGFTYSDAGAVEYWRASLGLPRSVPVISPHNSYWWWGYGRAQVGDTVIGAGVPMSRLRRSFGSCRLVGVFQARHDLMDDLVRGSPLAVCRATRPWSEVWPHLRFSA